MKIIDKCPSCISSSTEDSDETLSDEKQRQHKRKNFLTPFAIFIHGCDKKFKDQREFYSKFYTAPTIQPRIFSRSKKYEIERKHKVKKRDLMNSKLNISAISSSEIHLTSSDDVEGKTIKYIKQTIKIGVIYYHYQCDIQYVRRDKFYKIKFDNVMKGEMNVFWLMY